MAKFANEVSVPKSPIRTIPVPALTHEGGIGYLRDAKSELFLLAASSMVREDSFYEQAQARDGRLVALIHQVTAEDPQWVLNFIPFLRNDMRMRSASIVVAAEYVAAGGPNGRQAIASALQRPDEPGEMLGYWHSVHGRNEPKAVKRGIGDALERLYNEKNALKYDGSNRAWRFGDVIDRVHPKAKFEWQNALFKYLLDTAHGREDISFEGLTTIQKNKELWSVPVEDRKALLTKVDFGEAGMSWEDASSWVNGPLTAEFWEALIPSMGAMALVRNLRNFEEAGISKESRDLVKSRISDPKEIARSRQLPFRFYTAYNQVRSLEWAAALEQALVNSVGNIPDLPGKSLILVDVSGSMQWGFSDKGQTQLWEQAALFGFALAAKTERCEVVAFSTNSEQIEFRKGDSLLRAIEKVQHSRVFGGGTNTWQAVQQHLTDHDRVIIVTDEQAHRGNRPEMPMLYTFNVGGYKTAHAPSGDGKSYTFGGLSDAAFLMLPMIERGRNADWPF